MSERKVLNKYYDPSYNPGKLPKNKKAKDKQDNVRMMLPMKMRCTTCGNSLDIQTKFNMRKETCMDEKYLTINIYRFYFRCTQCYAEITFKTDPKNNDYVVEHGAKRSYEAWKDDQQAEQALKNIRQNEEEGNVMKSLEYKAYDSKREMDIMDALNEIKQSNKRKSQITHDQLLDVVLKLETGDQENVKDMFKAAKERDLDRNEENKTRGTLNFFGHFAGSNPKVIPTEGVEAKRVGSKITLKAKKVKTEQESLHSGQSNLVPKENNKKNFTLNLCSYSDNEDN